mgnify:CR=1 FL=1
MKKLSDIGTIKDILSRHGFTFSKSLGQNFLINRQFVREWQSFRVPERE